MRSACKDYHFALGRLEVYKVCEEWTKFATAFNQSIAKKLLGINDVLLLKSSDLSKK